MQQMSLPGVEAPPDQESKRAKCPRCGLNFVPGERYRHRPLRSPLPYSAQRILEALPPEGTDDRLRVEEIAETIHYSTSQVHRSLIKLKSLGVVRAEPLGPRKSAYFYSDDASERVTEILGGE